jgi:hypothetical protein
LIVEHELLEQILDSDWPLSRAASFIDLLGKDGLTVLQRLWQDGNVEILADDGSALADWKVRDVVRERDSSKANQVGVRRRALASCSTFGVPENDRDSRDGSGASEKV